MNIKLLTGALILTLLTSVFLTRDTNASYSDREGSNGNSLTASTLDMSIRDTLGTPISSLFDMDNAQPGDTQEKTLVIVKEGTEDFTYRLRMEGITGSPSLCDAITLGVKHGATPVYSGDLAGFTSDPTTYSIGSNGWTFSVHIDDDAVMNSECDFSLRADAWQIGSGGLWGLSDTESVSDPIHSKTWVVVAFSQDTGKHTVSFKAEHIQDYTSLDYKITYTSGGGNKGIQGAHTLSSESSYEKTDLFLGSCTSGGTCTPDTGVTDLKLTIELTESGGSIHTFEKTP